MQLVDAERQPIELGPEVGRGGEGVVCSVLDRADLVAKIYSTPPVPERVAKLAAMVEMFAASPAVADWCAWPQSLLFDGQGACRGFLMPRVVDHRPIHDLYDPEQRKAVFPHATWDFLARTAANCARMFASLHRFEVIVGDVNERNLLVGHDATVRFVDCDSFQFTRGGEVFRTGVGVVDYTPPELQGADFRAIVHTRNHDRFGLAVIVFKLLFMGRHPFSGGPTGDLAQAIKRHHYDHAALAARLRHLVPPGAVTPSLRALFEAAFRPESTQADARPSPDEWQRQLDAFEHALEPCAIDPLHRLLAGSATCPWCDIESALRYSYFARPELKHWTSQWSPRMDRLEALKRALDSVQSPLEPSDYEAPPDVAPTLSAVARLDEQEPPPDVATWYVRVLGGLAALAGAATLVSDVQTGAVLLGVGIGVWVVGAVARTRRRRPWLARVAEVRRLGAELRTAQSEWLGHAYQFREQDRRLRIAFDDLGVQHASLPRYRLQEIDKLHRDAVRDDLRGFLRQFTVEAAAIPGLTQQRRHALMIRGILTAADVERPRLAGIPGLTEKAMDAIVGWRQALELQAGAGQRPPATPAQLAAIDANCMHIQENLEAEMARLLAELRAATAAADATLDGLNARAAQLAAEIGPLATRIWEESRYGGDAAGPAGKGGRRGIT